MAWRIRKALKPQDESKFLDAICDDLNTPNALAVLYEENKALNNLMRQRPLNLDAFKESYARLRAYEYVLGLTLAIPALSADDKRLYEAYYAAKAAKDFAKSDEYRDLLLKKGSSKEEAG
jgi:cysteinyl-tRNA synthetase